LNTIDQEMTGPRTLTNRVTFLLLSLLVFTIPFDDVVALPGFGTLTRLLGYATLLSAFADVATRQKCRQFRGPMVWAMWFVGWAVLSLMWTASLDGSLERLSTIVSCLGLFWMLYEYTDSRARVAALLQAYVLGGYVCVGGTVHSLLQGASIIDESVYSRYAVSRLDPNDLATILALGIPMAWHLALSGRSRIARWVNYLYLPLSIVGIVLTGSRGGLLTLITALLMVAWSFPKLGWRTKAAVGLLVGLMVLAASSFLPETAWSRFATIPHELSQGTMAQRTTLWRGGFDILQDHAVLGLGVGAFEYEVFQRGIYHIPQVAHSVFLGVLFDLGAVGIIWFVALVLSEFRALKFLAAPEKRFCLFLLLTWLVAGCSLSLEYRKITWLLLGLVAAMTTRELFRNRNDLAAEPGQGSTSEWSGLCRIP
jgi:O-antigen ligase